jgi:hypothetical protein
MSKEKVIQIQTTMTLTVGTYHFGKHRTAWGIWVCDYANNGSTSSSFVKDVCSYEDAVRETYRLNGWGEPKRIYKRF